LINNVTDGTVVMENTTVSIVNAYPSTATTGGNKGIEGAVTLNGFTYAEGTGIFTLDDAPAACNVVYAQAEVGGAPTITNNASVANCQ